MRADDVLILSRRWGSGRGAHTSVERFCHLLSPRFSDTHGRRRRLPGRVSRYFKARTNSVECAELGYSAPYNSHSFELELWGLGDALRRRAGVVFFPYADYDYFYWQYFKKVVGAKLVLWSFFSERELRRRFANLDHFARADLLLAAGHEQVRHLSARLPRTRVEYFPIGVDTDFFHPGGEPRELRLVHVGNNRRDYGTLVQALDIVSRTHPAMVVDLVGSSVSRARIPERPYLRIHDFLDDEAYRAILHSSTLALLCLNDGGSSNSLLELAACGLPLVSTDLPNVRDYLDDAFAVGVAPGNAEAFASGCLTLLASDERRRAMGAAARRHAQRYAWPRLVARFHDLVGSMEAA